MVFGIEGAVLFAILDDHLIDARVAAVGDHGLGVVQLAVRTPHFPGFADHGGHGGIDDHVARHVQVGDALVGVHHRQFGPGRIARLDIGFDLGARRFRQLGDFRVKVAQAVIEIDAQLFEDGGVLGEGIGEKDGDRVAEHDGIGDLHHGRLEVQRQEHALVFRVLDLRRVKRAQRTLAHHGGVDDLARLESGLVLEDRDRAVVTHELDAETAGFGDGDGLFAAVEVGGVHVRHMGFGVSAPGAHLVRMRAGIFLDRGRGAAIRVAFAQDRVDGAAENLGVARLDLFLGVIIGGFGIVRDAVSLGLQFLDGSLQLRERGADIGELDDIGFRLLREFAQLGQIVGLLLSGRQILREIRENSARQGYVPRLDGDTGNPGKSLYDGQQRIGRERRGFVNFRPNDFRCLHGHAPAPQSNVQFQLFRLSVAYHETNVHCDAGVRVSILRPRFV